MNIWIVSMECLGIQEAGGVKNVTYSLAKEFSSAGHEVTLFLPEFKCTSLSKIKNYKEIDTFSANINICNQNLSCKYAEGIIEKSKIKVVFILHDCFLTKDDIYVYSQNEENENFMHKKGCGHEDVNFLDVFFQKAVCSFASFLPQKKLPDIIHCHDASTACLPAFSSKTELLKNAKTLVTIHNAGPFYHHEFKDFESAAYITMLPSDVLEKALNKNRIEPFLIASQFSTLTTVSDFYAEEITNPENDENTDGLASLFFSKNIKIHGITNGIDYSLYNPSSQKSSFLPFSYNPLKKDLAGKYKCRTFFSSYSEKCENFSQNFEPYLENLVKHGFLTPLKDSDILLSYHGRIVNQKGIQILQDALRILFSKYDNLKLAIAGQGDNDNVYKLINFANEFNGKIVYFEGYNKRTSRLCVASSDFIILPSFFEPCCLEDFIAQIFGTIPIAHKTGGLKKIIDGKTGFTYTENTPEVLADTIDSAIQNVFYNPEQKISMIQNASQNVKENYSWKKIAREKYITFFKNL